MNVYILNGENLFNVHQNGYESHQFGGSDLRGFQLKRFVLVRVHRIIDIISFQISKEGSFSGTVLICLEEDCFDNIAVIMSSEHDTKFHGCSDKFFYDKSLPQNPPYQKAAIAVWVEHETV